MLKKLWLISAVMITLSGAHIARAEEVLDYLTQKGSTDQGDKYTGPTLEDNVALMDTDHNGFADVYEVRAFLEKKHGKGYEKDLLDKWESSASGKSCSTPFAKELYSDKTY